MRALLLSGLLAVIGVAGACSGKNDEGSAHTGSGFPDSGLFYGLGADSGAGGGAQGGAAEAGGGQCPAPETSSGCVGELFRGETIPLDIYVMFDQSGSMLNPEEGGVTRIDAVRSAVGQFLQARQSAGISVGIGYFGQQPIGQTTCDPADYAAPAVEIGLLPGVASSVIESLSGREPTGETPSGAAIRAACGYTQAWKSSHPGHKVVMLLVTDGEPKAPVTCGDQGNGPCCPTLPDAVAAATECHTGDPAIETYVLGVGPFLDNLGQIAQAGGTEQAYLVSGGDVAKQVLDALNKIRSAAQIPCDLALPPPPEGQTLDFERVNIVQMSSDCVATTIYYRTSVTECDARGGWYYDDPAQPTRVHLCETTCTDVSLPGAQLTYSVGCAREIPR